MQPEPEAQGLALASELFITGTLNTFAQRTNVDTNARIIDYDIRELGEQLMPLGMLVTLDAIYNRVIRNWKSGKSMPGVLVVEIALLLPGQERWKTVVGGVQYDYCTERGEFFSCVAKTLEAAHFLCEDWMMRRERY